MRTFFLFFCFFSCKIYAQTLPIFVVDIPNNQLNFTQLLKEIAEERPNIKNKELERIEIKNISVRFNDLDRKGMDFRFNNKCDNIKVNNDVTLSHIDFDDSFWFVIKNMHFKNFFKITSCKNVKIIFKDCTFERGFKFDNNDSNFLKFENCHFLNGFMYHLNKLSEYVMFDKCTFSINPKIEENYRISVFNKFDIEYHLFHFLNKTEPFDLIISNSKFTLPKNLKTNEKYYVNITDSNFKNLKFENTIINTVLNLSATTVENQFQLEDGTINGKLIIDAININPQNARIQWTMIEGKKISVFDKKNVVYSGKITIKDEKIYNRIVGCYSTFYQVFKSQGNRFYANNCYIEWKNIETEYLKNIYKKTNNTQVYFIYLMNIFLRDFCSYGTDPLKSIYLSTIVILSFATLYFLISLTHTKSVSDNKYFSMFSSYISNDLKLILSTEKDENHNLFPNYFYKKNANQNILSRIFNIPIILFNYKMGIYRKIKNYFYNLLNVSPKEWISFSLRKKIYIRFILISIFLIIFILFFIIRIIDAISLSLNVFSTLGFGDIPVERSIKYLAILEGFIGWFLLSIFSVCLISQVIQ